MFLFLARFLLCTGLGVKEKIMETKATKHANLVMLSRQHAVESEIESLSEALSNGSVSGYQSLRPRFEEHIQDDMSFVKVVGKVRNLNHGPMDETGQRLDFATTKGYFAVMTPKGVRYTRNGKFRLNQEREVVNSEGYPLLTNGNTPIVLSDPEKTVVSQDGVISTPDGTLGRIKVVEFENEQKMDDSDLRGYFTASGAEIVPSDFQVYQGFLEGSNVDRVSALMRFSILSHRWQDTHHFQKKHDEAELEAPSKLAPV